MRPTPIAICILVACSLLAALTLQPGLDYFNDASAPIDALVRGDVASFFHNQPLMGPLTLVVRAPFVATVFHSSLTVTYFVGAIPCVGALVALATVLWRRMAGRPLAERALVALLCVASPVAVKAIHWGHPEELAGAACCVGALLAAAGGRPVAAGLLLGAGLATKQWALLALAPVLLALPGRRFACAAIALGVGALATLPMLLGDPQRFELILRAAGSADPATVLGVRAHALPAGPMLPQSLWQPLGYTVAGEPYRFVSPLVTDIAHPLVLLSGLPLAWLLWRRDRGQVAPPDALRLLALIFALRCVLDPNDFDYYHAPLMAVLAALAAHGGVRELRAALLTGAGLGLAFAQPVTDVALQTQHGWLKWCLYMATMLPLLAWLARDLYVVPRGLPAGGLRRVVAMRAG